MNECPFVEKHELVERCEEFISIKPYTCTTIHPSFEFTVERETKYPTWAFDFFKKACVIEFEENATLSYEDLSVTYRVSNLRAYYDFLYKVIDRLIEKGKLEHYDPKTDRLNRKEKWLANHSHH